MEKKRVFVKIIVSYDDGCVDWNIDAYPTMEDAIKHFKASYEEAIEEVKNYDETNKLDVDTYDEEGKNPYFKVERYSGNCYVCGSIEEKIVSFQD